jgi:YVTN family beta-propeller protein
MTPTRRATTASRRRSEAGDTLVEILFAIVVFSMTSVAAFAGFTTLMSTSAQYRIVATIDTVLKTASTEVVAQLQDQASPLYATCATAAQYQTGGTNAVSFSNVAVPTGYTVQITQVQYWSGSVFMSTCLATGTVTGPQPELITVTVTNTATGIMRSNSMVIDNPYAVQNSFPPDLLATQLVFQQQPGNVVSGTNFTPSPTVAVESASGTVLTNDYSIMTMAITAGTGSTGAVLSSTCAGTESSGIFTFANCNINGGGAGYTLTATDGTLSVASNSFNVTTQLAQPLITSTTPSTTTAGAILVTFTGSSNAPSGQTYSATACTNSGMTTGCVTTGSSFTSGSQISGLTPGTNYFVTITANASTGYLAATSPASSATMATVQLTAPVVTSTTAAVTATSATGQMTVTFTGSSNAPTIQTYVATVCTNAGMTSGCVTQGTFTSGSQIAGLTLGTSYFVTITATASSGYLVATSASGGATLIPTTVPGPPTSVTGTFGNVSAIVSWTAPLFNGGSPITGYTVTATDTTTIAYNCPSGGTLSGTQCIGSTSVAATVVPTMYTCPSGGTLSGTTCTVTSTYAATYGQTGSTPAYGYSCPSGGSLSGTQCSGSSSYAATPSYSCSSGLLSGANCITSTYVANFYAVSATQEQNCQYPSGFYMGTYYCGGYQTKTVAAAIAYSCPSGGSLSGSTCVGSSSYAATPSYSCSSGSLSGANCITSTYVANLYAVSATQEQNCQYPSGFYMGTYYCGGYRTTTVAAAIAYTCPSGGSLSGSTCYKSSSYGATYGQTGSTNPINGYSCPSGGTLSSTTCTTTSSYAATLTNTTYTCPSGGTLSGSTCTVTSTYAASYVQTGSTPVYTYEQTGSYPIYGYVQTGSTPNYGWGNCYINGLNQQICTWMIVSYTPVYTYEQTGTGYTYGYVQTGSTPVYGYVCNGSDSLSGTTCTGTSTYAATASSTAYSCSSGTLVGSNCVTQINYAATVSGNGGQTCTTTGALTCTVAGLTNGHTYTFTAVATNINGSSVPSLPSNIVTPATVPNAPTGATATRGNAQATVTWTAPASNGGTTITGYTVTSSPGGRTCTTTGPLTCTVSGLTNGTAYTFTVTATNVAGTGVASAPSNAVTPATVPGAPTNVTASPGNSQATVTWTAPTINGGSPITGYTVTSSPGGFTCTTTGALTCTVTGLTNGSPYSFSATATNAIGVSQSSANFDTQMSGLNPAAWWKLNDAIGSTTVADSSGHGYTGTVSPTITFTGSPTLTFTGSPTLTFTGSPTLNVPSNNSYAYLDTGVVPNHIAFDAYTSSLGDVIFGSNSSGTGYSIRDGGTGWASGITPASSWFPTANASGVVPISVNAWHHFDVSIVNGMATLTVDGTVLTSNFPVASLGTYIGFVGDAAYGGTSTNFANVFVNGNPVALNQPGAVQGSPSDTSTLFDGSSGYVTSPLPTTATTSVTLNAWVNLNGGSAHGAAIWLGNANNGYGIGVGNGTMDSSGKNLIGLYQNVSWIATPATLTPGWNMLTMVIDASGHSSLYLNSVLVGTYTAATPIAPTGSAYVGYGATANRYFTGSVAQAAVFTSALTPTQVASLYTAGSVIPNATVPGAPTGATAAPGNTQATVSWTAPASNGGSPITGYTVTSSPGGFTCTTTGALVCTVTGLTNGTSYTFTVVATNSVGTSATSTTSNAIAPHAINVITATVSIGSSPYDVAVNPAGTYAYVTNYFGNSVSVVNLATNTVTATITGLYRPEGITINPAGTYAYVADYSYNEIFVINLATNTVVATPTNGAAGPSNVAFTPNGAFAYVTANGSNAVTELDTTTLYEVNYQTINTNPFDIAINAAGTYSYVTIESNNTLNITNLSTGSTSATISGFATPTGVVVNPAGTFAYVTNNGAGTVSVVNLATNTISATIPVALYGQAFDIAINPAGTFAYVTNPATNNVSVINLTTNTVTATITGFTNPYGITINSAGTYAYVTNYGGTTLSVVSIG